MTTPTEPTPGESSADAPSTTTRRGRPALVVVAAALVVAVAALGVRVWQDRDTTTDEARPAQRVHTGGGADSDSDSDSDGGADTDDTATSDDDEVDASVTELPTAGLTVEEVARVGFPTSLVARPGTGQLYVTDKVGVVRRLERADATATTDGASTAGWELDDDPVLDISDEVDPEGERGLLGLAFSPDGDELAIYWTALDGTITIDVLAMDGDGVDPASRRTLLEVPHPRTNHNGGQLVTGPDGMLYAGLGDGGGAGDPDDNGQDATTLLGTILRIDPWGVTDDEPYVVPDDNPFASGTDEDGRDGAPEVWLWGVRNPWRFSFDRATADLWIGDVGQNDWEEIDLLPAEPGGAGRGANLGWSELEGTHPFDGGEAPPGAVPPVFEYGRDSGECSVTGGYVYRGTALPSLRGVYVYADLCRPEVRGVLPVEGGDVLEGPLGVDVDAGNIVSFGEDADGELYVLTADGAILRIVAA